MKIKTIWDTRPDRFDERVNRYLGEGMTLTRREVIPDTADLDKSVFYAELVQLDPAPEPEQADPLEAVRAIRSACLGTNMTDCHSGRCPLAKWCEQLSDGGDPTDWVLPEDEVKT